MIILFCSYLSTFKHFKNTITIFMEAIKTIQKVYTKRKTVNNARERYFKW